MLMLSGVTLTQGGSYDARRQQLMKEPNTMVVGQVHVSAPVRAGLSDIVNAWNTNEKWWVRIKSLGATLYTYRLFFIACVLAVVLIVAIAAIVNRITSDEVPYEVSITHDGSETTVSSEDIAYDKLVSLKPLDQTTLVSSSSIDVVNASGVAGLGAQTKYILVSSGYTVRSLRTEEGRFEDRTVIVFRPSALADALAVSKLFNGAPLSSVATDADLPFDIVIYTGRDIEVK
jgi:hypothetical protein